MNSDPFGSYPWRRDHSTSLSIALSMMSSVPLSIYGFIPSAFPFTATPCRAAVPFLPCLYVRRFPWIVYMESGNPRNRRMFACFPRTSPLQLYGQSLAPSVSSPSGPQEPSRKSPRFPCRETGRKRFDSVRFGLDGACSGKVSRRGRFPRTRRSRTHRNA